MTASGFYHCSVRSIGRGNGASVVQKAAYRAGARLEDERTGEPHDYRARGGVDETFIVARANAPPWAHDNDIGRLWNEAERVEPRVNGRTATEAIIALPHELDAAGRRQAAVDFVRPVVERYGVAAQVSLHAPDKEGDQRNWHAHILFSHRELGADGFGDIANRRTITKKVKGQEKQIEIAGIAATPADIKAIRKDWEQVVNRAYERAGLDIRVDHRSHKDRGIEQEPTKHLGPAADQMEKDKPGSSDRVAVNREITQRNAARILAAMREAEVSDIKAEIVDAKAELAMQEAHAGARGKYDRLRETEREVRRDQFDGRYDELRAAEPPPEVVREFGSNANRTAEPVAPVYDRDQDNAAWEAKLAEAAIDTAAARAMQEARDAAKGRTDDMRPEAARGAAEARRQPEPSASPETAAGVAAEATPDNEMRPADRVTGRMLDGLGALAQSVFGGLADFLFGAEPKLTPDQAARRAASAHEQAEVNAQAAAAQEKAADQDERIFNQDRQQQQEDFAARYGVPGGSSGRSRERDEDYDRGRERER